MPRTDITIALEEEHISSLYESCLLSTDTRNPITFDATIPAHTLRHMIEVLGETAESSVEIELLARLKAAEEAEND